MKIIMIMIILKYCCFGLLSPLSYIAISATIFVVIVTQTKSESRHTEALFDSGISLRPSESFTHNFLPYVFSCFSIKNPEIFVQFPPLKNYPEVKL